MSYSCGIIVCDFAFYDWNWLCCPSYRWLSCVTDIYSPLRFNANKGMFLADRKRFKCKSPFSIDQRWNEDYQRFWYYCSETEAGRERWFFLNIVFLTCVKSNVRRATDTTLLSNRVVLQCTCILHFPDCDVLADISFVFYFLDKV